jgi:hypothetical protein
VGRACAFGNDPRSVEADNVNEAGLRVLRKELRTLEGALQAKKSDLILEFFLDKVLLQYIHPQLALLENIKKK